MRINLDIWLSVGRLDGNHHIYHKGGPSETIHGPKFTYCRLEGFDKDSKLKINQGHRVWFYFPSGACWNFDWDIKVLYE